MHRVIISAALEDNIVILRTSGLSYNQIHKELDIGRRQVTMICENHELGLDHIKSFAEGGTHTKKNSQCAHFICNSIKGAKASESGDQLRIF